MNNSVIDAKNHFETKYSQLQKQKESIRKMRFGTETERITYLKENYLSILADSQLADSIWRFELRFPLGSIEHTNAYINKALHYLNDFFHQNQTWFLYYRSGETHLDHQIFDIDSPLLETYAKVMTAEMFEKYLHNRFEGQKTMPHTSSTTLTWTDKQVALVELATALSEVKAFNHGNISLSVLISTLAEIFNFKLTQDPNRIFQDIKNRKKHQPYF